MADEDPIDDLHGSMNMAMMSAARVSEQLLRSSQNKRSGQLEQTTQETAAADERYEAQARIAEQFYARAASPEFVRAEESRTVASAWRGAQQWRDVDEVRFGAYADRMTSSIREVHHLDPTDPDQLDQLRRQNGVDGSLEEERQADGVDRESEPGVSAGLEYDSPPARQARVDQINQSNFPPEVKAAMKVADNQNGRDPVEAAGSKNRSKPGRATKRTASRGPVLTSRGFQ